MKTLIIPFQETSRKKEKIIFFSWLSVIASIWLFSSFASDKHLFPSVQQVLAGFAMLFKEGLVVQIASSLGLFLKSATISVLISLIIVYLAPLPIMKPISSSISSYRYLPLVGLSFYISILIDDGRLQQTAILVVFMSTFLITSLLNVLKDIAPEEYDHAKTLGCSRWEMLWEVVIIGRFDYVIESVRQNLAIVWMALVSVESLVAANGGLGFLIKNSDKFGNHGRIIALQIIILIIGIGLDIALTFLRKNTLKFSKF